MTEFMNSSCVIKTTHIYRMNYLYQKVIYGNQNGDEGVKNS